MNNEFDVLKLENQLCFPLYVCSKEIIRKYNPILKRFDLTYTQYITLLALFENDNISVNDLSKMLFLDSGTITPLLKKMEIKGFVSRERSNDDERQVFIKLTEKGRSLRKDLVVVPYEVSKCLKLSEEEITTLYNILNKMMY